MAEQFSDDIPRGGRPLKAAREAYGHAESSYYKLPTHLRFETVKVPGRQPWVTPEAEIKYLKAWEAERQRQNRKPSRKARQESEGAAA